MVKVGKRVNMLGILPYDYYVLVFEVRIWHCVRMFTLVSNGFKD